MTVHSEPARARRGELRTRPTAVPNLLTGAAMAGNTQPLTPLASTTPAHVTIVFDTTWADEASADIVGVCR